MRAVHLLVRPRDPFELPLVVTCLASGALGLALPAPGPSNNIAAVFGQLTGPFYAVLLVSAIVVVVGYLWRRRTARQVEIGLQVERAGLYPLGGAAIAYGIVAVGLGGRTALVAGLLTGGIGVACLVRALIVRLDLRALDAALADDAVPEEATQPGEPR